MHLNSIFSVVIAALAAVGSAGVQAGQIPLLNQPVSSSQNVSVVLFAELEELARLVDISYCVGGSGLGVTKPFTCLSRCADFDGFELVTTWNTGALLSDSCGYIALDHAKQRIIVAFRGTYSIANTIVDLSSMPQKYVPYLGEDEGADSNPARLSHVAKLSTKMAKEHLDNAATEHGQHKCKNCTVHMGFSRAWRHTRNAILPYLEEQLSLYPSYRLNLVGHSLGGAVAALAALDLQSRGLSPLVTTFGEPRVGNQGFVEYLDARFDLRQRDEDAGHFPWTSNQLQFRRVTHVDDPVPLLPWTEWGYAMHAGEIHITKPSLSPDVRDLQHCNGDNDRNCIAGQDPSLVKPNGEGKSSDLRTRNLLDSVRDEIEDVNVEPWGIPSRYKLWQLFFAHRDYFWRLGLCVPGSDPLGGGKKHNGDT